MSMHKTPLTDHERKGLVVHGMDVDKPSQLSDAFRLGMKWSSTPTTYHVLMRSALYYSMKPEDCESDIVHIATSEEDIQKFLKDHNISPEEFDHNKWVGTTSDDGEKCWYHVEVCEQGRYAPPMRD